MNTTGVYNHWRSFWREDSLFHEVEKHCAREWWERFQEVIPVSSNWRILDFGCGHGYLLRRIASRVDHLVGMDISPAMINISKEVTSGLDNVSIIQIEAPPDRFYCPPFDLIIVNSCIQYLSDRELKVWMKWWLGSLTAGGRLVLSDLYPRRISHIRNLLETLVWGRHNRCLSSVLYKFFRLFRAGYKWGKEFNRDSEELLILVRNCDGEGRLLPRNLDSLSTRYSLLIEKGEHSYSI